MTTPVDDADLPRALVKRIVKQKLSQLEPTPQDGTKKEFQLNKDALLAFSESAKIFIAYITAAANDACKDSKRQTLSEADVLSALEELDFGELVPPLKASLEAFKEQSKQKNAKKASDQRKRKAAEKRTAERAASREAKRQGTPQVAGNALTGSTAAAAPLSAAAQIPALAQGLPLVLAQQLAHLDPQQQQQYLQQMAAQHAALQRAAAQQAAA